MEDKSKLLLELCEKWRDENKVSSPESIYQCDWIIESSYDLMENICDIIGYYEYEDDKDL